jgi:hypothetical protein
MGKLDALGGMKGVLPRVFCVISFSRFTHSVLSVLSTPPSIHCCPQIYKARHRSASRQ